jgi:hypothetical protein
LGKNAQLKPWQVLAKIPILTIASFWQKCTILTSKFWHNFNYGFGFQIRAGEYEGLEEKLKKPEWAPGDDSIKTNN